MNAKGITPILNVADIAASFAWFQKWGWRKCWDWGTPPTFGAVGSGECEIFLCQGGQGSRGRGANACTFGPQGDETADKGAWMSVWVDDVEEVHKQCSAAKHCLWTSSTSSTQTDIQAPLSAVSSPCGPNVQAFAPRPRLPWPPWQRKISHSPDPTAPKVGGVPQSQHFLQPHFSNHTKLLEMSDTFNIGVMCFAFMLRRITRPGSAAINPFDPARLVGQLETW